MASILKFRPIPTSRRLYDADHHLATRMDVNVLHSDLLLALAPMPVERFEQRGKGVGELIRLGEILAPALESLLTVHSAPVALHRRIVGGDQLRRHHALQLVLWPDASQSGEGGAELLISRLRSGRTQRGERQLV